jgi:hypothetical protein
MKMYDCAIDIEEADEDTVARGTVKEFKLPLSLLAQRPVVRTGAAQDLGMIQRAAADYLDTFGVQSDFFCCIDATQPQENALTDIENADPGRAHMCRILAPPGCGKTEMSLILVWHLVKLFPDHLHSLTSPTKKLSEETLKRVTQVLDPFKLIPLGQSAQTGNSRLCDHQMKLIEEALSTELQLLDGIEKSIDDLKASGGAFEDLQAKYKDHYLMSFDAFHSDSAKQAVELHYRKGCVVVCTQSLKVKGQVEKIGLSKFAAAAKPGVGFYDETDMSSLWTILGGLGGDKEAVYTLDPGQVMWDIQVRSNDSKQGWDATKGCKPANPAPWLEAVSQTVTLSATRRFGPRISAMLSASFDCYKALYSAPSAPNTILEYVDLQTVSWQQMGKGTGAVFNVEVYAILLCTLRRLLAKGIRVILVIVYYRALRDLLKRFLSQALPIPDDVVVDVCSARQARGSTAQWTVPLITRRAEDDGYLFLGHTRDPGKTCSMVSRCADGCTPLVETWSAPKQSGDWNALPAHMSRLIDHLRDHAYKVHPWPSGEDMSAAQDFWWYTDGEASDTDSDDERTDDIVQYFADTNSWARCLNAGPEEQIKVLPDYASLDTVGNDAWMWHRAKAAALVCVTVSLWSASSEKIGSFLGVMTTIVRVRSVWLQSVGSK